MERWDCCSPLSQSQAAEKESPRLTGSPCAFPPIYEAGTRGENLNVTLPAQIYLDAEHDAPRIDEAGGQTEVRTGQSVGNDAFLGCVVQRVEHIDDQFDALTSSERNRSRKAQVEQSLTGEPATATRLEQDTLLLRIHRR